VPGVSTGVKGGWSLGLTILPPSGVENLEVLGASTPWYAKYLSRTVQGERDL